MKIRPVLLFLLAVTPAVCAEPLAGTQALNEDGDLAAKMVQGIHRFLDRETVEVTKARAALWTQLTTPGPDDPRQGFFPDRFSPKAWENRMEPKRARLRQLLGIADQRAMPEMRLIPPPLLTASSADANEQQSVAGRLKGGAISHVRWNAVRGVQAEGLLFTPDDKPPGPGERLNPTALIIIPDCGVTPEQSFGISPGLPPERQWANYLAGTRTLAISLIDRRTGARMPEGRESKFSQREVLWRAGFEMGRTLLGYEIEKVLGAVDWLCAGGSYVRIEMIGTGDGGLIALYAAALDSRIKLVGLDGVFAPTDAQWSEPIDRTVFGVQREFGMAELGAMIAPRDLINRSADWPRVDLTDAGGGAPGHLGPAATAQVDAEFARVVALRKAAPKNPTVGTATLRRDKPNEFLDKVVLGNAGKIVPGNADRFGKEEGYQWEVAPVKDPNPADESARQQRMFANLLEDTQHLMRQAQKARGEYWKGADFSSAEKFAESAKAYREKFWSDITGKLPPATLPPNARSRQIYDTEKFTGWEIMLDVYPDVFSFGTLLLPKDMKPGEKRAVVVCQHGLEGWPSDVADPKFDSPYYHHFGATLAEKGYIVFAPQNPYIGKTEFRQICRKAWPIGLSLWSFIVRQHETILTWLKTQPNVDASRIAFYGLSYGGKSAMRLPALLPDYCLSICSADYNEWIWKNVDASAPYSYLHTNEYDMVEWNMGNTFNYAELSWLIFPRPFMVERGHDDGVSCDEWVAYEFARTRRHYSRLRLGDRAEIEFFNGPHTINGQGTFRFLDKWLQPGALK